MKERRKFWIWASCVVVAVLLTGSPVWAKEIKWRMTSTWPPSISLIEADQAFVKAVNQICKGRLEIKFFSGGSLMPSFEVFDAVSNGLVEAAGDWPNYWAGKAKVFDTLGSYPMGLTPIDYLVWIHDGGGREIYEEAYGKFGMMYLVTGVTPMESGLRSNKPIKSIADLKGMKIRMSGQMQGMLLKDLDAAQVAMAGQEIYQAMQKGTIDACEFSSPSADWGMGLGEVSKYWAVPGWHQPASVMGVMINKKVWDSLDQDLQEDIRYAAKAATLEFLTKQYYDTIAFTQKFIDKGVEINSYPQEDLDRVQQLIDVHTAEVAKTDPMFKKSIESQNAYRQAFSKWRGMEGPFRFGYNPTSYPDLK